MKCPFCPGNIEVVGAAEMVNFEVKNLPDGILPSDTAVLHSMPYCQRFDKEDGKTFLVSVGQANSKRT